MNNKPLIKTLGLLLVLLIGCSFGMNLSAQGSQTRAVTVIVKDAMGPLAGANVAVKGTSIGANTDARGVVSLPNVPTNSLLEISFVGYKTQDVPVAGKNTIEIFLEEDTNLLDELVVIGYGTVKKSDLTGSVSSVANKELNAVPQLTVQSALQGRSAGVMVRQNSGAPGDNISIRIRGANSIRGNNEPLYVIDGFPSNYSSINTIDNADIESIEVLKDASAIAIYGSRAANGVVMITTKKGKEGRTKIDFSSSYGFQNLRKKLDLMNSQEYARLYNEALVNDGQKAYFSEAEIAGFKTFDWQDFVFRTAPIMVDNLTVSGGSKNTQFSISGNLYDQQGIVKNNSYKRYSVGTKISHNLGEWFTINFSTQLSRNINDSKNYGGARYGASLINSALCLPPTLTPYDEDGNFKEIAAAYPFLSEGMISPVNRLYYFSNVSKANNVLANTSLIFRPFKDVTITIHGGVQNQDYRTDSYTSLKYFNSQGSASVSTGQSISVLNEDTINYTHTFGNKHYVSVLGGFTYQDNVSTGLSGSGTGFLSDITQTGNLSGASIPGVPSSSYSKTALLSYLGRLNYIFDNKYLLTASIRADGASQYSPGEKWGYFPSVAAAWRINKEGFMKDVDQISDLKLRTSYGLAGSQAIGAYSTLANLSSGKTVFGSSRYTTFAPGSSMPANLKWEITEQYDLGLDVGLFNDRYSFTIDFYRKMTRDLLNSVQLPRSTGYSTTLRNVGKIENKGLELSADANVISGQKFNWNLNGNISFNKSKVISLYDGQDILGGSEDMLIFSDNCNILREGEAVGAFYGYLKDGYNEKGDEIYKDLNNDGLINENDKVIIGDPNPDFIFGLNSYMSFAGFELTMFFQGSYGNDLACIGLIDNTIDMAGGTNFLKDVLGNYWTPQNTDAKYPRLTRSRSMKFSDRFIEDGSYLRLKNIELAYNLPVNTLNINWLRSLRIYASAQNYLTLTKYSGWDPEVNSSGGTSSFAQGHDHYSYPTAKSITFGINVGF